MYKWIVLKRRIESVVLFPFVSLGWLLSFFSKGNKYSIYFFFPFHHIGGAEKVHYQIAQAFAGKKCIIYFTRKSKGQSLIAEFLKAGFEIRDISKYTDNKLLYPLNFVYRGIISGRINRQKTDTLVFNGQSNFGYKISPWISKNIPQIDLIHALNTFSKIRIPFLEFYSKSVTVSEEIINKHKELYVKYKMPHRIINNILYINYGIDLPLYSEKTIDKDRLNVLYVGRGSAEKRVHLIAEIAKQMRGADKSIQFSFVGDVTNYIPDDLKSVCHLHGSITDDKAIDSIYRNNDVLVLTSSTESGPLVAMEAMARGLAIVSTPVGVINEHIRNEENGFTFSTIAEEETIIKEGIELFLLLKRNPNLRKKIADKNIAYAYANFGIDKFHEAYKNLFKNLNPSL